MAYVLNAWQSGHYPCKIAGLDMSYEKYHDVFAFQKNSPLEELFNYHIKKLRENGVLYRVRCERNIARTLRKTVNCR